MKPQKSPADLADLRRQNPKQQNSNNPQNNNTHQPVFLCDMMQPAAFLCVICAICGRITRKRTQSILHKETPMSPADLADLRRQNPKPQNNINLTNLSLSAE